MIEEEQQKVWVIDTSAILHIRRMYDPSDPNPRHRRYPDTNYCTQVLDHVAQLVSDGHITFPKQVRDELYKPTFNDLASQWVHRCTPLRRHGEPSPVTLRSLLAQIPDLVDYTKINEHADPYVVAQAIEMRGTSLLAAVVSEDRRNRGGTSIITACDLLGIPWVTTLQFLSDCNSPKEPI